MKNYQGMIFRRPFFFLLVDSFFLSSFLSSFLSLSAACEASAPALGPVELESAFGGFSVPAAGGCVLGALPAVLPVVVELLELPGVTVSTTAVLLPPLLPPPVVPTVCLPPGVR